MTFQPFFIEPLDHDIEAEVPAIEFNCRMGRSRSRDPCALKQFATDDLIAIGAILNRIIQIKLIVSFKLLILDMTVQIKGQSRLTVYRAKTPRSTFEPDRDIFERFIIDANLRLHFRAIA